MLKLRRQPRPLAWRWLSPNMLVTNMIKEMIQKKIFSGSSRNDCVCGANCRKVCLFIHQYLDVYYYCPSISWYIFWYRLSFYIFLIALLQYSKQKNPSIALNNFFLNIFNLWEVGGVLFSFLFLNISSGLWLHSGISHLSISKTQRMKKSEFWSWESFSDRCGGSSVKTEKFRTITNLWNESTAHKNASW